jgi:hypothetical protein
MLQVVLLVLRAWPQPPHDRCCRILLRLSASYSTGGRGKVSDAADYRVASLHELPAAVPGLSEARPSADGSKRRAGGERRIAGGCGCGQTKRSPPADDRRQPGRG